MDLIDKQNRAFSVHSLQFFGFRHHFLHVLFAGYGGIDLTKLGAGSIGDHLC